MTSFAQSPRIVTLSDETQVNSETYDTQALPAMTALADGGYIVVWQSYDQDAGGGAGIYLQRYDAAGAPVGLETLVNDIVAYDQQAPAITTLDGGGYIVTWASGYQDGSGGGIYARQYAADGTATGPEFRVNDETANNQDTPAVTALGDGGYLIAYTSFVGDVYAGHMTILTRRYDASGNAGAETVLAATPHGNTLITPAVTRLDDGGYVVTWKTSYNDGTGQAINLARFDATGAAVGSEVRIDTNVYGEHAPQIAAVADGGYVVTWTAYSTDSGGNDVHLRRFDASGIAVGGDTVVTLDPAGWQDNATVTGLADGGYIVTWASSNGDHGQNDGIHAQRFTASGVRAGADILVNTTALGSDPHTRVIQLANGDIVIAWDGAGPSDDQGITTVTLSGDTAFTTLTSGHDIVTGTTGDDLILADGNNGLWSGDRIDGGDGTDTLGLDSAGTLDLTAFAALAHLEHLAGSSGDDLLIVDRASLSGITQIDGGAGNDTLRTADYALDLTAITVSHIERIDTTNVAGTAFNVADAATALFIHGGPGSDTVALDGFELDSAQRSQLFTQGVAVITSGAKTWYADGSLLTRGADIAVTEVSGSDQIGRNEKITALGDGGYVITWQASYDAITHYSDPYAGRGIDVYAQRYDAHGAAVGTTTLVNTTYGAIDPVVTALDGGGYVIAWYKQDYDQARGSYADIYAQRYDANGVKAGGETVINTTTADRQESPAITALADGGYIVAWDSAYQDSDNYSQNGIFLQRYDAAGTAVGYETHVDTTTTNNYRPALTGLSGGSYVVTWAGYGADTHYGIFAQVFNSNDQRVGTETKVAGETDDGGTYNFGGATATALAGGGYVLTWVNQASDQPGYALHSQRFDASGAKVGAETFVNAHTYSDNPEAAVTATNDGGYIVVWQVRGDGNYPDLFSQRFDASGARLGGETPVSLFTQGAQQESSLTVLADGSLVIGWTGTGSLDQNQGWQYAVYHSLFTLTPGGNTAPTLTGAQATLAHGTEDTTYLVTAADLLAGFSDADNNTLTVSGLTAAHATVHDNHDGTYNLTPVANYYGSLALSYNVDDGQGGTAAATQTVTLDQVTDTIISATTATLGAYLENLTLSGANNVNATGNNLANVLGGNTGSNVLRGLGGNDTLNGKAGADTMFGGSGDDIYYVDNIGDTASEQTVTGIDDGGTDRVSSSVSFVLSDGIETLTLSGTANIDGTGNAQANSLTGNSGDNILRGLGGNDSLNGGAGHDTIYGGDGNDTVNGGTGADAMFGGAGNDSYYVDAIGDTVSEQAVTGYDDGGTDRVSSSVTFTLGDFIENLTLSGAGDVSGTGNDLANTLTGNAGANSLYGLGDNDVLNGGAGADALFGGDGNDVYYVDNTGDTVTELAGQGTDKVFAAVSFTLSADVENITLTGTAAIDATGNGGDNILTGNSAANILNGGGGVDKMYGGAANDTYVVDNAADRVVELSGEGSDTVESSVTYTLAAFVENLTLTGSANINGTGNTLDNTLSGNSANNSLNGGTGSDILTGHGGADTFVFSVASGTDTITDFSAAQGDAINVHAYTHGAAHTGYLSQSGSDTVIDLGGGNVITVVNASVASVTAHMVW